MRDHAPSPSPSQCPLHRLTLPNAGATPHCNIPEIAVTLDRLGQEVPDDATAPGGPALGRSSVSWRAGSLGARALPSTVSSQRSSHVGLLRLLDQLARLDGLYATTGPAVSRPNGPFERRVDVTWQPDEAWMREHARIAPAAGGRSGATT